MKSLVSLLAVACALVGCASSSEDVAVSPAKPGEGQPLNPTGKPQTPEAQAMGNAMQAAGQAQNAAQDANAKAMAEAMRKGGK